MSGRSLGQHRLPSSTTNHQQTSVARPFARFGVFPIGGRSTAVKLVNGDIWVLASTPLDSETKTKLDELGPVK